MININHILVFKTNIDTFEHAVRVAPLLSTHPAITEWSVDMEDVDCVLRVVSETLDYCDVILLLESHGHFCADLDQVASASN